MTRIRCVCGHSAHSERCGAPVAWTQEFHDVALRCNCIGPPLESATPIQFPDMERERFRAALERIRDCPHAPPGSAARVAREALEDEP